MVFYRKYRSKTIEELDSAYVRDTLYSVLSKDIPHAFLFTGQKGLGKTSTARIIAKVVNCNKRSKPQLKTKNYEKSDKKIDFVDGVEPCNECEQCVSIMNGTNMDVVEIDAASNRGIDEMRAIREKIWLAPLSAAKKVYIIDEVHMLTTEAFNALLKTLEEPPEFAMFILCTTEPQKIPGTILSRCFHVQLSLATNDEIVRSLTRVIKGEKLEADKEALYAIARMSDGGFREGVKILEEMSMLAADRRITAQLVEERYQVSSIKYQVSSMFEALIKRDTKSGLQIIEEVSTKGTDIKFFLQQLIGFLHESLLEEAGIKNNLEFTINKLKFSIEEIKILFELFSKAYADMRTAVLPQLPLELAIIEYISAKQNIDGKPDISEKREATDVTVATLKKQVGEKLKLKALTVNKDIIDDKKPQETPIKLELLKAYTNGEATKEWMETLWKAVIAEMREHNHTIAGVLRSCTINKYDKKLLVIGTAYKFHKERLDDVKAQLALKSVCKRLTGNDVEIGIELSSKS